MISTVLIVEDEHLQAIALRNTLASIGLVVLDTVPDYQGAVTQAKNLCPDLIVMDIQLEGEKNGIEAAESIRGFSDTPIIFHSSLIHPDVTQKAGEMGETLVLHKTVSAMEWSRVLLQFQNKGIYGAA